MKEQLIILLSVVVIVISIIIIIFKFNVKTEDDINIVDNSTNSVIFETEETKFIFYNNDYNKIVKMFELADHQAMRYQMYPDTNLFVVIQLGKIDNYVFEYHRTLPHYHYIEIIDTVNNLDYYFMKTNKFVDDLIFYTKINYEYNE